MNHMFNQGIKDVEFVVCNTDEQALKSSSVPNKLQIGTNLTEGLGAGANPERGKQAALESKEDIRELLGTHTKMVFITAGMGGGTGTGAAPVIAKVAKELDILTVGIVTAPFAFEGKKKRAAAENGIQELSENCDTVLVILNDKLREMFGNLPIRAAFAKADNILSTAAKSIAEIITVTAEVNVDFEDVKTVMKDSGAAVMGSAITEGENRALRAAEESLSSPLLNNTDIHGAQKILLSIMSGDQAELEMDELTEITDYIQEKAGDDSEVIFGHGIDSTLGASIRVTVIATGFARNVMDLSEPKKEVEAEPTGATQPQAVEMTAAPVAPAVSTYSVHPPVSATQLVANDPVPVRKPAPVAETSKIIFDLDSNNEIFTPVFEEEALLVEATPEKDVLSAKMIERRERLRRISLDSNSDAAIKEKLEIPAYLRKQVQLENVVPSTDQQISRFNLNDDNELLGDNRFLHDNVD